MKPVRKKLGRHFGSAARQVTVRSRRPWYFLWFFILVLLASGYGVAYWQYARDDEQLGTKLEQAVSEAQSLHTQVVQLEQQLQIEKAAQSNLEKKLNGLQDDNIKLKEDLLFYKNMVGSAKKIR